MPGAAGDAGSGRSFARVAASARILAAALTALALFAAAPARAAAPLVHPWLPKHADSLTVQSTRARTGFRALRGDSATGDNALPYQQVARIARDLLRDLGHDHMSESAAIEGILKSQGLIGDLRLDPQQPSIALLMVRNPYAMSAEAVAFLYWWRGTDLKYQGQVVPGGRDPHFRAWWSGQAAPYSCAFTFHENDARRTLGFMMLRMEPDAGGWDLIQFPGNGPEISASGEADFHDVNGDGVPELVAWLRVPSDSAFTECTGCPSVEIERIFTLHEDGFELEDSRVVPTAYTTFQRLIHELVVRDRGAASRLLARPSLLDSALAEGWGVDHGAHSWRLARVEGGQQWPRWLDLRNEGATGHPEYAVHFAQRDGRWVINYWYREPSVSSALPSKPEHVPDARRGSRP
jgi:hypothetical protein